MSKLILFQGDSITDCGRARDNNVNVGVGYPLLIKATLGHDAPNEYQFINRGVSGNRVVDLYARIKKDFINLKPDYASIYIGVNDAWHEINDKNGVDTEKADNVEIREYINDMDVCMSAADVVVCRAGASSLSELQAMGKASILIPSPNVAENHQYHNAMALVNKGAALIIEEKDITREKMNELFESLINDDSKRKEIEENAKAMAVIDAKEKIAEIIISLIK